MSNEGGGPPATIAAANTIHANNILAYAVGVGDSINMDELNAIASEPSSQYVRLLSNFDINELRELQESLNSEACQGNILNLCSLHSCIYIYTLQKNTCLKQPMEWLAQIQ